MMDDQRMGYMTPASLEASALENIHKMCLGEGMTSEKDRINACAVLLAHVRDERNITEAKEARQKATTERGDAL